MSCLVNHSCQDLWDQLHPQAMLKSLKAQSWKRVAQSQCFYTNASNLFWPQIYPVFQKVFWENLCLFHVPQWSDDTSSELMKLELVWWVCVSLVIFPYLRIFCLGCLFIALRRVLMIREEQISPQRWTTSAEKLQSMTSIWLLKCVTLHH